ncbi:zinc ribbon domain-containing protein, partial [Enterococcus faecium]
MAETSNTSPATLETQPYWDAARDGRLLIKTCRSCGQNHSYP